MPLSLYIYTEKEFDMKQFIFLLLAGLLRGIGDQLDTAFGNNLGIDSICVLSSFIVVTWITSDIFKIGSFAVRVNTSHARNCMLLQILVSIAIAVITLVFRNQIVYIYSLTEAQRALFKRCLFIFALLLPFQAAGDFYFRWMVLKCKNKAFVITQTQFYTFMIAIDAFLFFKGCALDVLLFGTLISYVIHNILCEALLRITAEKDKICLSTLKADAKHGMDIVVEKFFGSIASIVYASTASTLGTEIYAIHCIGYSIVIFTNSNTSQLYNYQLTYLYKIGKYKDRYTKCCDVMKKALIPVTVICYAVGLIMLFVIHGEVPLSAVIIPTLIYCNASCASLMRILRHS